MKKEGEGKRKVFFVGAGPGDPELLTIKGRRLLEQADVVLYTGSLIPQGVLGFVRPQAELYNTAEMILEEIIGLCVEGVRAGKMVVRLHSGDPSIYGTLSEQIQALSGQGVSYEVVPGVSSAFAAAAALGAELTVPETSQTVIFTRIGGKTPMPPREDLSRLAAHQCTLVIFLSAQYIDRVVQELSAAYAPDTPVAVVQKASWPEQKIVRGTLSDITAKVKEARIVWTALIIVGEVLRSDVPRPRSHLYDADFAHGYRERRTS